MLQILDDINYYSNYSMIKVLIWFYQQTTFTTDIKKLKFTDGLRGWDRRKEMNLSSDM